MTRRIVLAILLTVWATLLAGGMVAYFATRSVLLADLDAGMLDRASSLPDLVDESGKRYTSGSPPRADDRYLIRNEIGRTIARPDGPGEVHRPAVLRASFVTLPGGQRLRTLTLDAYVRNPASLAPARAVVTFSGSAAEFDGALGSLFNALLIGGLISASAATLIARHVAKQTLAPLHQTAETIGTIDQSTLDRRIDEAKLPPELVPMARRLNEMLARLQEAYRQRQQFLADAAHELRTPVAALVTTLEVALRRPRDAESYRRTLEGCRGDAEFLRALVEALMSQARGELQGAAEPFESIELHQLLEQCAQLVGSLARERGIRLECCLDACRGVMLHTQAQRVRSAVINLLSNAIEHTTAAGSVQLAARIQTSDSSDGAEMAVITVQDNGVGIAPQHLPRLFEPFYRVDPARQADQHLGLGLYLVRTHVEHLGGKYSVQSAPGEGSTFEITIPGVVRTIVHRPQIAVARPAGAVTDLVGPASK